MLLLVYIYLLSLTAGTLLLGASLLLGRPKGAKLSRRSWLVRAFSISLVFLGVAGLLLDALGVVITERDQFLLALGIALVPGLAATLLAR